LEGDNGPDGGRNPAKQSDLEYQADDAGDDSSAEEKGEPGKEDRDQGHWYGLYQKNGQANSTQYRPTESD